MATTYSYACKDFPGMEACPAHFHAETDGELLKIIELHAQLAHGETLPNGQLKTSPNSKH